MGQGHAGGNDRLFVILNNIAAEFMATRTPEQAKAIETKSDMWYEQAEEAFVKCRLRIRSIADRLRDERTKAYTKRRNDYEDYLEASPCTTRPKVAPFHKALSEYGKRGAEAVKRNRSKTR
jgi:hypothetical protein